MMTEQFCHMFDKKVTPQQFIYMCPPSTSTTSKTGSIATTTEESPSCPEQETYYLDRNYAPHDRPFVTGLTF